MTLQPLFPRQPVPSLSIQTVGGETWQLSEQTPENFTLIVFYRGFHCPICKTYLADLEKKLGEFEKRGVSVVAISSDAQERAERSQKEWGLENLTVGYGLALEKAREWGLYISASRGKTSTGVDEPARFSEPALYLVKPGGTLYFGSVQTMPFARPNFREVLGALDFVLDKDYPARGEITDAQLEREPDANTVGR